MISAVQEAILTDRKVSDALKALDRERLLEDYKDIFATLLGKYSITHFYFHGPDRVNLLRVHNPERNGDLIDRFTALEAERIRRNRFLLLTSAEV